MKIKLTNKKLEEILVLNKTNIVCNTMSAWIFFIFVLGMMEGTL